MFLKAIVLFASTHLGAARALPKGKPQHDGYPRGPALVRKWSDVARQSAEWWFRREHMKAPDGQTAQALHQSGPHEEIDEFLDFGVPPLGESPYDCSKTLPLGPGNLKRCSSEQMLNYSGIHGMHAESKIQPLIDLLVYTAYDPAKSVIPCKIYKQEVRDRNMFEVVVDSQFSNQPYCCPLEYMPDGGDATVFEDLSYHHYVHGSNMSYSVLEPMRMPCSEDNLCPVVVELPGDAKAPWLLLQAWCYKCSVSLRTLVVSMSDAQPAAAHVEAQLIPAVTSFLTSRNDIDRQRVYLVSTGGGNEAGLLALLTHPDMFAFGLFAGKFRITKDIELAAASLTKHSRSKLKKISFNIGSSDVTYNEEQDFWRRLTDVVKPIAVPVQVELRYYPGGSNAMWYAAWNAYHDLLWTGKKGIEDYLGSVALTCAPGARGVSEKHEAKPQRKWQHEENGLNTLSP